MQKHTTVKPKHCIKCIWFWLTVDYCSEKCAMRQLSTLFKMHSIDMVDYEGHLPILHASLLIWAGNWKRQRRTRKQKKKRNSRNISSLSFSEYKPHIDIIQQSMNQTSTVFLLKPADHWPWNRTKMYNSQERSVMPTGQKKIYWTLTITFFSPSELLVFSSFGFIPYGLTSRSHCQAAQGMFALPSAFTVFTLWKRDAFSPGAFSPGAKLTSCKLRIAAVRWKWSQRPPSTCVRGKPNQRF